MSEKQMEAFIKKLTESGSEYDNLQEINVEDIEIDKLLPMEYEVPLTGMVKCPECGAILYADDNKFETTETYEQPVYDGFDMYHTDTHTVEVEKISCPCCNYECEWEDSDFYEATTEDLLTALNREEYLPGITKAYEEYLNKI